MRPGTYQYLYLSLAFTVIFTACSEEPAVYSNPPELTLNIDSVHVDIVPGINPADGQPAGNLVRDIYYELEGSPGAIFRASLYIPVPGGYSYAVENRGIYWDPPFPADTPLEKHWNRWIEYDYSGIDSISGYISIEAYFWREVRCPDGSLKTFYLGEDSWYTPRKIDIRDADEQPSMTAR